MLKNKNVSRMLAALISLAMLLGMTVIFPATTVSAETADETLTDNLVNGDMEQGSWYAWAGDNVLYDNGTVSLTGNSLNGQVSTDWIVHNAHSMVFADWNPVGAQQVSQTDPTVSEMVPGCRTTIKEDRFAALDPAKLEFSVYARSVGTAQSDYLAFGVKYRVVNNDGTYGAYHTASLLESFVASEDWVRVSAVLDDLTAECANARTIEFEFYNRIVKDDGWGGIFLDDADVTVLDLLTDTVINGDMEEGSWYAWAGDNVVFDDGETVLTGNDINGSVSTYWNAHSGRCMIFAPWDTTTYREINGDWHESETIPGCKTTIKEDKFAKMDLSQMTYSMWAYVMTDATLAEHFFAFDVKYRAVNNDGTYGPQHVTSLKSCITSTNTWIKAEALLDDMTEDCENARTIEIEVFTMSYCAVFLDDADITAPLKPFGFIGATLENGNMEQGSWYTWAGDAEVAGSGHTGNQLNSEISTTGRKHGGQKGMQFMRDWGSYPSTGEYGESETIAGCKTTMKANKFAEMDLSQMTFSMWVWADSDQFFALDVKYRAVNFDGTTGADHTLSLRNQVSQYGTWVKVSAPLDNMMADCPYATTIEFELYTKSYCSVYLDDADVTSFKMDLNADSSSLVNGDMESGSWYVWAGDTVLVSHVPFNGGHMYSEYNTDPEAEVTSMTGAELNSHVSTTETKHGGNGAMVFARDSVSYPSIGNDSDNGRWNESQTIPGCKTTMRQSAFENMDLSRMAFSMWVYVYDNNFFAFNVKYRAVNTDGTFGAYHTIDLRNQVTEYGTWVEVYAPLDDMTAECANARTIEFEVFTKSYCTVYLDDADVITLPAIEGDIDGNDTIDSEDLVLVRSYLLTGNSIYSETVLDINKDGNVNIADLVRLKKILVNVL